MLGLEDKRQVTMVISSNIVRTYFHHIFVFIGSTHRTLPLNHKKKTNCIKDGFLKTYKCVSLICIIVNCISIL
jgi:hypothetical protein